MSESKTMLAAIPGVFYRKPSPEEDVYVNEGGKIEVGDIIGLIEVMKTFYEVKAEQAGTLESFLVEHDTMVDAGQELAVLIEQT